MASVPVAPSDPPGPADEPGGLAPEPATLADVPALSSAFADAFIEDPVYAWLVGPVRHRARLRAFFTAELQQYVLRGGGTIWTIPDRAGGVAAMPPGAWEMTMTVSGREALLWLRALGLRMARASSVARLMEERHLREPHWYVRLVGVRTALQGQGLGTRLMAPVLRQADADGLPAYIEASTERSAALYARLGFVHLGVVRLPGGGPPVWPMRRPPERAGADDVSGA